MGILGLAAALFGLDQYLKQKIENQSPDSFPRMMEGTGGIIRLYRNHNSGFCFEFLRKKPELVRMLPVCFTSAAAGVLCFLMTKKGHMAEKTGYALIVSGALSNLYDRLKRGYVVDYFSFQPGFLKKVVFNIGDLCIAAGAVILTLRSLMGKED